MDMYLCTMEDFGCFIPKARSEPELYTASFGNSGVWTNITPGLLSHYLHVPSCHRVFSNILQNIATIHQYTTPYLRLLFHFYYPSSIAFFEMHSWGWEYLQEPLFATS
jgi:hypothetical protein